MAIVQASEAVVPLYGYAEGVPEPIAIARYVDAMREFCKDTRAWLNDDVLLAYIGDGCFVPSLDTDAKIHDVIRLSVDDHELTKMTRAQMMKLRSSGRPRAYRVGDNELEVQPDPGENAEVEGQFALWPTRNAQRLDEDLVDRFGEVFEYGALSRLLAYPGKPWTSFDGAEYYGGLFREALDRWRTLGADEGMTGVPRRVRQYGGY